MRRFFPTFEISSKNGEESEFLNCIRKLTNEEFLQTFYFGIIQSKDNQEKIIFDYNNINISFIWDEKCF